HRTAGTPRGAAAPADAGCGDAPDGARPARGRTRIGHPRRIRDACAAGRRKRRKRRPRMTAADRKPALRPVPEVDGLHGGWPRGDRLVAVRSAGGKFHERFAAGPRVEAVKTFEIAEAPYPSRFAFQGYSLHANSFITIVNRMMVIQFRGFDGGLKTLVWEPTVPEGSAEAPFYHAIQRLGNTLKIERFFAEYVNDMDDVLPRLGLANEDVDYVSFDHLHVQDVRMIMGSREPIEGESAPRE